MKCEVVDEHTVARSCAFFGDRVVKAATLHSNTCIEAIVTFMCPIAEMTFNSRVTHAIFGLFEFLPVPKGA